MSTHTPEPPPATAAEVRDALHWWHETYGSGFSPHRALVDLMAARSALAEAERRGAEKALRPLLDLFTAGPDTSCRITWRTAQVGSGPFEYVSVEHCEVPMDELRNAFDRARAIARGES